MRPRQPQSLPRLWLFTDERVNDDALLAAIRRLPKGSGVVFRHYGLVSTERRALFRRIEMLAHRRDIVPLLAGQEAFGRGVSGRHNPAKPGRHTGLATYAAHNAREIAQANQRGADLIFLSPVFPTRSHPGAPTLGPMRFAALARLSRCPVIALGGMNASRFRRLKPLGAYGWAAIDALMNV